MCVCEDGLVAVMQDLANYQLTETLSRRWSDACAARRAPPVGRSAPVGRGPENFWRPIPFKNREPGCTSFTTQSIAMAQNSLGDRSSPNGNAARK